ncbi:fasciclin domain-containing protein [Fodinibius sediminis]|uniref:fasciclin domain-containing protein n=1 Tax=Fodinibius sediminis TaxID=1214077 RepID=UPI00163D4F37|nr:fasciclin domain-containing protein [Fodinibius sediminis]
MNNRFCLLPVILLISSLALTSCLDSSTDTNQGASKNLLEQAQSYADFDTFVDIISDTELNTTIANEGPLTLLVPTNDAFDALPSGTLESLTDEQLIDILSYHVIEQIIDLNQLSAEETFTSMQGDNIFFVISNDSLYINGSNYVGGVGASNGVLYATDQVLFPDAYLDVTGLVHKRKQLSELDKSIDNTGLASTLEDTSSAYTIFAPSNTALQNAELSADTLKYHVVSGKLLSQDFSSSQTYTTLNGKELSVEVSGSSVTINGEAAVTTADIEGVNGVVHIIDTALAPPSE